MNFIENKLKGLYTIEPVLHGDARGFFMETWRKSDFDELGIAGEFVQDNHSRSKRGILRGLHYQNPRSQGKLVRVTLGEVYDVVVDIRRGSPTYGQWLGETLSEQNRKMLWVPPGFAHGFYVTSEYAEFTYKCTDYYAPQYEFSLRWDDPALGIDWPIPAGERPILSQKDQQGQAFAEITPIGIGDESKS